MHKWSPISQVETQMLKGLSILLIVLHNFFHFPSLNLSIKENQADFDPNRWENLLSVCNLTNFPRIFFSYFGHFGVGLFIFLSAYGLAISYKPTSFRLNYKHRFVKLYPFFLFTAVLWMGLKIIEVCFFGGSTPYWSRVAFKLLLVANIIPHEATTIVGPWWFMSFIIQLYLVFPLLMRLNNPNLATLTMVGIALQNVLDPLLVPRGVELYYTFLGHLPEICLGLYLARTEKFSYLFPCLVALIFAYTGNINKYAWTMQGASITLLLLISGRYITSKCRQPWLFLGAYSPGIFLINTITRKPFALLAGSHPGLAYGFALTHLISTCMAAVLLHVAYTKVCHMGFLWQLKAVFSRRKSQPEPTVELPYNGGAVVFQTYKALSSPPRQEPR